MSTQRITFLSCRKIAVLALLSLFAFSSLQAQDKDAASINGLYYSAVKTVFLKPDVAETYVPVKISVSYAGQTPVPKPFLMIVLWVKEGQEWKMSTDIAIPIPQ